MHGEQMDLLIAAVQRNQFWSRYLTEREWFPLLIEKLSFMFVVHHCIH